MNFRVFQKDFFWSNLSSAGTDFEIFFVLREKNRWVSNFWVGKLICQKSMRSKSSFHAGKRFSWLRKWLIFDSLDRSWEQNTLTVDLSNGLGYSSPRKGEGYPATSWRCHFCNLYLCGNTRLKNWFLRATVKKMLRNIETLDHFMFQNSHYWAVQQCYV